MKNIDYIIQKGRFKIILWDFFFISIILFGIMGFSLVIIAHTEENYIKLFTTILTFIVLIMISFLYSRTLINKISFEYYINKSTKTNEKIISEILNEFSLNLYKQSENVFHSFYYLPFRFWKFRIKKDVYFIIYDNTIMLNVRDSDDTIVFNLFRDKKEISIRKSIKVKVNKPEIIV